ncbi:hypothetical protein DB347_03865 [Opitutaceae bacterium EW11]|nr:hypothetical protein DB347_03865 [Opitutaceae bacterium EW11]
MYPALFAVALIAGGVDAIAGGGGLITVPVLLNLGLPPQIALGTNKLQASFGSTSAAWHYSRAGLVDVRTCGLGILFTLVGSVFGALAVQKLDAAVLQRVIPWLLVLLFVYTAARPTAGHGDHPPRLSIAGFFIPAGLALGFYDGFLGPGTGSFWTVLLIAVMGFNFLKATATTKVMNATSNLGSLALFLLAGSVHYKAGLVMGAGQLVGSRIGAHLAVTRGARFVRPVFLGVVAILILRLLYSQYLNGRSG